jgi:hypothetical protein
MVDIPLSSLTLLSVDSRLAAMRLSACIESLPLWPIEDLFTKDTMSFKLSIDNIGPNVGTFPVVAEDEPAVGKEEYDEQSRNC